MATELGEDLKLIKERNQERKRVRWAEFQEKGAFELRQLAKRFGFECIQSPNATYNLYFNGRAVADFWPSTCKFRVNPKRTDEETQKTIREWARRSGFFKKEVRQ